MNNLLLFMSLCGGAALSIYYVLKFLLKEKLSPFCRCCMLTMALGLYLLPVPLMANELKCALQTLFQDENLFRRVLVPGERYIEDLSKRLYVTETDVVFPRYSMLAIAAFVLWLLVCMVLLLQSVCRYYRLKKNIMAESESLGNILEYQEVAGELSTGDKKTVHRRRVKIQITAALCTPFTYGVFQPVIVIPQYIKKEELKYILAHELKHIWSFDFLVRILCILAVTMHFYNPLSYLLFYEMSQVSELRCDAKVLKNATQEERLEYGRLVISSAKQSPLPGFVVSFSRTGVRSLKQISSG